MQHRKVNITMENETLCYDREVCRNKSQCPVKDIVSIDSDCPAMLQIIKAVGTPYIDVISIFDNKVVIDGVINVSILYVTGDDTMPVYCANGAVPLPIFFFSASFIFFIFSLL